MTDFVEENISDIISKVKEVAHKSSRHLINQTTKSCVGLVIILIIKVLNILLFISCLLF